MTQRAVPDYPVPHAVPEPDPPASRRAWGKIPYEERFRQQRRELLDAAAALTAEQGVAGTTVASITSRAGLAKRVFYDHFTDKEACFVELLKHIGAEHLRRAVAAAEAAEGRSAYETLRAVIQALVTPSSADRRLAAAARAEIRHHSGLSATYDEHRRQVADLLVAVALRLGSKLPEDTIRLFALVVVHGVTDLGSELRARRSGLREVTTMCCLAFGLPPE